MGVIMLPSKTRKQKTVNQKISSIQMRMHYFLNVYHRRLTSKIKILWWLTKQNKNNSNVKDKEDWKPEIETNRIRKSENIFQLIMT